MDNLWNSSGRFSKDSQMGKLQGEPENFTGRIIFMSMFNDLIVSIIQRQLQNMQKDFFAVIGLSWASI